MASTLSVAPTGPRLRLIWTSAVPSTETTAAILPSVRIDEMVHRGNTSVVPRMDAAMR
jgi:hypothetical protein